MSGRGRGGRGGGKGGYVPPSGGQLFLKRSAQECGLDSRNLRALHDATNPLLYPELRWHSRGTIWQEDTPPPTNTTTKRSVSTVYLIQKQREIHRRMQTSVYNVRSTQETDVLRYRPQNNKRPRTSPDRAVLQKMGMTATPEYVPEELLMSKSAILGVQPESGNAAAGEQNLEELEAGESQRGKETSNPNATTDQAGEDNVGNLSDDEDEEGEDYVMNYYESEEESEGGGGDREATF